MLSLRCLFGLVQQELIEYLLRADWQEGGGTVTTLGLKKDAAAHPSVPSKADGQAGEPAVSQVLATQARGPEFGFPVPT